MSTVHSIAELQTGVYAIVNLVNGKIYVGSAADTFRSRWATHRRDLRRGTHFNQHLQKSWDKHGGKAFEFKILERCPPAECLEAERKHIRLLGTTKSDVGYNKCEGGGGTLGFKWNAASRAKLSATRKTQCADPAFRLEISKRFSVPKTEEHKEKTRRAKLGKKLGPHTAEAKAKIGAASKLRCQLASKRRQAKSRKSGFGLF